MSVKLLLRKKRRKNTNISPFPATHTYMNLTLVSFFFAPFPKKTLSKAILLGSDPLLVQGGPAVVQSGQSKAVFLFFIVIVFILDFVCMLIFVFAFAKKNTFLSAK